MVDVLKEAREAIQSLWTGLCDIFCYEEVEDKYGVTSLVLNKVSEKIKCRLSFKNITQTTADENKSNVTQVVKLFVAPEIYVPPGSIIEVTQNNVTRKYKYSGLSAIYTNHQEIILDAYEEVA